MFQFYSTSTVIYLGAALAEIAGCFTFWAWLRQDKSGWWLIPGLFALALFAYLLTRIDVTAAGRAYAAYGGLYIATSLIWLWLAEGIQPNVWDLVGAGLATSGALVILVGTQFSR
ncbi:hypothetical protein T35B1_11352 [Salinisphaera shabanensis T35B1]|uniref:YnfA family protein n=1 Tax=Salinisphaera aquimarina TaxID=2094031 RepID=A0ABV7EIW3_9GAMM